MKAASLMKLLARLAVSTATRSLTPRSVIPSANPRGSRSSVFWIAGVAAP